MCLRYKSFENTAGKGEIARNEQFLLFPVFSTLLENFLPFSSNLKLSPANSFCLEESENVSFGKELKCRLQFVSIWTNQKFCRLEMGKPFSCCRHILEVCYCSAFPVILSVISVNKKKPFSAI